MLDNVKLLPKVVVGAVIVGVGAWAVIAHLPAKAPEVAAAPVQQVDVAAVPVPAPMPASAPDLSPIPDQPQANVTSGDAGMNALIQAGKK